MNKDTVGSHVIGIEKLRKALEGDKLVCLAGRHASHFIMEYLGVDTRAVERDPGLLHPSDVAEYVKVLQRLTDIGKARGDLGLLLSNNPLVLNELQPGQVFLVTHGCGRVTPLTETRNFAKRYEVFEGALGALWLSYLEKTEDDSEPGLIQAVTS